MAITQLSAFLANTPGTLSQAVSAISEAGINLRALSVADTTDFGVLRVIVSDIEKAKDVLGEHTIVSETPVIAVKMDDRPAHPGRGADQHRVCLRIYLPLGQRVRRYARQ